MSCVYVVYCVCESSACRGRRAVCGVCGCSVCVHTHGVADVGGVWRPGDRLGAKGAAAVAGALSKLVNLTNLDLGCRWNVQWLVSCVYTSGSLRGR